MNSYSRENSWDYCFGAFGEIDDLDILALHLGFYLASWGMYRGSSGLLQMDYTVHKPVVEIVKSYPTLRCRTGHEVKETDVDRILQLKQDVYGAYSTFMYVKDGKEKVFKPSDTLISKVLLGTLGCVPAFDRFFLDGITTEEEYRIKSLTKGSLYEIFRLLKLKQAVIIDSVKFTSKQYVPVMKKLDVYYWNKGLEIDQKRRNER